MKDKDKKKDELLKEIAELRRENAALKVLEVDRQRREEVLREPEFQQDISERNQAEGFIQRSKVELRRLSSRLLSIQEDERRKIARELHDGIGQSLSAVKFLIENILQKSTFTASSSSIQSLETVIPMIQNAIEEVRRIQTSLRPPILDDLGIIPTVSWFCREYQKIYSKIDIQRDIHIEENEVPDSLKTVIYRVLQEAMNNIAKYSQATRVRLSLKKKDEEVELVVEDNGVGFAPQEILSEERDRRGFGLTSMRERTELSGGSFSIESEKGAGTRVRTVWRLKRPSSS
ncbi:MAG TPA: sensor histidine kinase [Thermodesulfobacteriota bacterium]|nr:sensor histidine kinase [Thermodesulfobacteriota bacterium]